MINRLQIEAGLNWKVLPSNLPWREWLFSFDGGATVPGQSLLTRDLPAPWAHRFAEPIKLGDQVTGLRSRFLWLHASLRILGLDLGVGLFYALKPKAV